MAEKIKLNKVDVTMISIFLLQDAGTFGILPLNIYQIIMIILGVFLVVQYIREPYSLPGLRNVIILVVYMFLVTIIITPNLECIWGLAYLAGQLGVLYLYVLKLDNYKKLYKVVYITAFILSAYGLIQQVAYFFGIDAIYNISNYGFALNGNYASSLNTLRGMSLYAEPAHLSGILGFGVLIGLLGHEKGYEFTSKTKTIAILLMSICTQSVIVYIAIAGCIICYLLISEYTVEIKLKMTGLIIACGGVGLILFPQMAVSIWGKLTTLISPSATAGSDLSGFAVISNLQIAIEKMKDGYIFGTGYETHVIYYEEYIQQLYNEVSIYINQNDAASLYTRIFSEFGIIGYIICMCFILKKFKNAITTKNSFIIVIISILLLQIMRNGHYAYVLSSLIVVLLLSNKFDSIEHDKDSAKNRCSI